MSRLILKTEFDTWNWHLSYIQTGKIRKRGHTSTDSNIESMKQPEFIHLHGFQKELTSGPKCECKRWPFGSFVHFACDSLFLYCFMKKYSKKKTECVVSLYQPPYTSTIHEPVADYNNIELTLFMSKLILKIEFDTWNQNKSDNQPCKDRKTDHTSTDSDIESISWSFGSFVHVACDCLFLYCFKKKYSKVKNECIVSLYQPP